MITGYNHNVKYKDLVFHIQTEDSGEKTKVIATHVFYKGNVITTRRSDYNGVPKDADFEKTVKTMMQEQHQGMMKSLIKGEFDNLDTFRGALGLPIEAKEPQPAKGTGYQIINPKKEDDTLIINEGEDEKSLDEMILEYLSEKKGS